MAKRGSGKWAGDEIGRLRERGGEAWCVEGVCEERECVGWMRGGFCVVCLGEGGVKRNRCEFWERGHSR